MDSRCRRSGAISRTLNSWRTLNCLKICFRGQGALRGRLTKRTIKPKYIHSTKCKPPLYIYEVLNANVENVKWCVFQQRKNPSSTSAVKVAGCGLHGEGAQVQGLRVGTRGPRDAEHRRRRESSRDVVQVSSRATQRRRRRGRRDFHKLKTPYSIVLHVVETPPVDTYAVPPAFKTKNTSNKSAHRSKHI